MYTYVAQPDGGVAGGRASDGATVWRASIGHAGYPPVIVGSMLFADAQKQGEATEAVVAVRATDGHVLWTTHFPNTDFYALVNADSTTVAVGGAHYGLYTLDAATGRFAGMSPPRSLGNRS